MTSPLLQSARQILVSSTGRGWTALDAELVRVPAGPARARGDDRHVLGMHFGPPVRADCRIDGLRRRGVQKPGDIGLVPAGADGSWEDDADCQILRLSIRPALVERIAADLGRRVGTTNLEPRLQFRDAGIEAIGWAVKADLEADTPSDPLYVDCLTSALVVRLIEAASDRRGSTDVPDGGRLSRRQSALLIDYIETHLDRKLRLDDLASIAGMSPTRLKTSFRNSMGMPVHQYVIRRRVEYARALVATTAMPASQIALVAGFAHQSHMTTTMRRVLGVSAGDVARLSRVIRPIPRTLA